MNLFNVYPLFDIEPVRGEDAYVYDKNNTQYLDLYGGHAVISIGHSHPHYVWKIIEQLNKIGFYSNSVKIPIQQELAEKLGELSTYEDYSLFLCNSGAEAIENALKMASFHNGRKRVVAMKGAFHGRTSLAVACTDNPSINAEINKVHDVVFTELNDTEALTNAVTDEVCAVIIEGMQGFGGVRVPSEQFLKTARQLCDKTGAVLILDEIQSGFGRSGKFFAHQHSDIQADIISMAKGMGNGFPIAGILLSPKFEAKHGMLGTTFGGNYLACAASIAVLDVLKEENLIENAQKIGNYLMESLAKIKGIKEVRGLGLMIGIELFDNCAPTRLELLHKHHIFTGSSSDKNTLRILPPLCINKTQADRFLYALNSVLQKSAAAS